MNPSTESVVALAYNRYRSLPFHRSVSEHWDVCAEAANSNSVWLRPSSNLPFGTVLELQFCQSSPVLAGNSEGSCSKLSSVRCFVTRAKMEVRGQLMKRKEVFLCLNANMLIFYPEMRILGPNHLFFGCLFEGYYGVFFCLTIKKWICLLPVWTQNSRMLSIKSVL